MVLLPPDECGAWQELGPGPASGRMLNGAPGDGGAGKIPGPGGVVPGGRRSRVGPGENKKTGAAAATNIIRHS